MNQQDFSRELRAQRLGTSIVERLTHAGYVAYFAGGWVRDYLLHHPSSDVDIATDAPLDKILDLFPNTIKVGLAFGVVIVALEGFQFEVSTFRKDLIYTDGRKPDKIEFSNAKEDAKRRDFTINGMFYDPLQHIIYDYVHGAEDLSQRVIRTIGDPYERFKEDRLRMIRAIRFASRFDFHIDEETQEAIIANADTLFPAVAIERVWQELKKMAAYPLFDRAIIEMQKLGLLQEIFPELKGVHLNFIKEKVTPFSHYPKDTLTIYYIMSLFPNHSLEAQLEIGRSLKISNHELAAIELFHQANKMIREEAARDFTDYEWVKFYAKTESWRCVEMIAAQSLPPERETLLKRHHERLNKLLPHVERARHQEPLVTSGHLRECGIPPGIVMGNLLKQAEKVAVLHHCKSAEEVLLVLKQLPQWPLKQGESSCPV